DPASASFWLRVIRASTPDTAATLRILPVLRSPAFIRQEGSRTVSEPILEGKTALVAGVANKRSIAWAIAQALHGAGATLAFTYQGERLEGGVRKLAAEAESDVVVECDVSADASIDRAFEQVGEELGGLDIFVHSIAFAP